MFTESAQYNIYTTYVYDNGTWCPEQDGGADYKARVEDMDAFCHQLKMSQHLASHRGIKIRFKITVERGWLIARQS